MRFPRISLERSEWTILVGCAVVVVLVGAGTVRAGIPGEGILERRQSRSTPTVPFPERRRR